MKQPIFISGLRKSGTSMVKNLLDNHPALFIFPPNEFHFFTFTHYYNLGRKPKHKNIRKKPMPEVIEQVCESKWFNPWKRLTNVDWDEFVDIEQLHALIKASPAASYRELFIDIARAMATATTAFDGNLESHRFTCKGVQQEEFFPELREWFPDLKMIYVLRNPYAQLNSAINNMRHGRKGFEEKLRVGVNVSNLDTSFKYPYLGPRLRQMRVSYYFMRRYAELCPSSFYILKFDDLLLDTDGHVAGTAKLLPGAIGTLGTPASRVDVTGPGGIGARSSEDWVFLLHPATRAALNSHAAGRVVILISPRAQWQRVMSAIDLIVRRARVLLGRARFRGGDAPAGRVASRARARRLPSTWTARGRTWWPRRRWTGCLWPGGSRGYA